MTTKWDELVEVAARAAWDHHGGPVMWDDLRPGDRNLLRAEMDAALRALRAAGVVMVPADGSTVQEHWEEHYRYGGFTYATDTGHEHVIRDHEAELSSGEMVVLWRRPATGDDAHMAMMAELRRLRISAALSAGQIKPEGE